jgi:hypothetical protein
MLHVDFPLIRLPGKPGAVEIVKNEPQRPAKGGRKERKGFILQLLILFIDFSFFVLCSWFPGICGPRPATGGADPRASIEIPSSFHHSFPLTRLFLDLEL